MTPEQPYTEMKVAAGRFQFLGEPSGNALNLLKHELTNVLVAEGNTRSAYLSKVQYLNEDKIHVALIIDGMAPAQQMAQEIAAGCLPLVDIDLFFFESLSKTDIERLQASVAPFFLEQSA